MLRTRTAPAIVFAMAAGVFLVPQPAFAQSQAVSFNVGFFSPTGEDGRADGDVLVADLSYQDPFLFEINDFLGASVGAEWLIGIGRYVEAGVGASYYSRTVPSIYADVVHEDGREIEQDLKLRIAPVTGTIRFFPLGRYYGVQPYLGGGVALLNWRYSETGEFVDPNDRSIFRESYVKSDSDLGGVFLGGIRFPINRKVYLGGELQYQKGEGELPFGGFDGFLGDKIDLSGWAGNFTIVVRFGS